MSSSGGAPIDFYEMATGHSRGARPPARRTPDVRPDWEPIPPAWFNEAQLRGTTIEASARGQANWHLHEVGQGAMSFEVMNAGGGLVVSLTAWNDNDIAGLYIVLDDDAHESYVARVSALGSDRLHSKNVRGQAGALTGARKYAKIAGVAVDSSFRLDPSVRQSFWLIYRRGALAVGRGSVPGAPGSLILQMASLPGVDRSRGNDLYHFGFARVGSRWVPPMTVRSVVAYKYAHGPVAPLPPTNAVATSSSAAVPNDNRRMLYRGGNETLEAVIGRPSSLSSPQPPTLYGQRRFPSANTDRNASF